MKKIFRMATVVALACASLTYTSCTKDYSEEINDLNTELSSLQSKHDADIAKLEGEISTLKTTITSLESAYKAADAVLQGSIDANASDIATLKNKLAAAESALSDLKATVATLASKDELAAASSSLDKKIGEVSDDLAGFKQEILAKATKLEADLTALESRTKDVEDALADLQEVYAALANSLTSVVFMPDFYYGGIEATSYNYANLVAKEYVNSEEESTFPGLVLPNLAGNSETADVVIAAGETLSTQNTEKAYTLGQCGVATYSINPSSFDVESAKWALVGSDLGYAPVATPELSKAAAESWAPKFESIKMENGVAKVAYHIEGAENLKAGDAVSVMSLVATLEDGKTVTSDAAAVLATDGSLKALALAGEKEQHLFDSAEEALKAAPLVKIAYNGGKVDLAEMITIHDKFEAVYTLAELNAKYGDKFTMTFDNIEYTVGKNELPESVYAEVTEAGEYTPMWVKDGEATPCTATEGLNSVGHHPVVFVTLKNGEDVVLAGFFKVEVVAADEIVVDAAAFDKQPLVCKETRNTKDTLANKVYRALSLTSEEFASKYTFVEDTVYVKIADEAATVSFVATEKLGYVSYSDHSFTWTVSPKAVADKKTNTVYARFTMKDNKGADLYVGLTLPVAKPATLLFGQKLANEWKSGVITSDDNPNTVVVNVPVPSEAAVTADPHLVEKYLRDLNSYLVGGKATPTLAADADPVYNGVELNPVVAYKFSVEQPKIADKYQLVANKAGNCISVAKILENGDFEYNADEKIAEILEGKIKYAHNAKAKEILNLWGIEETVADSMVYANVSVDITYGECAIEAGNDQFHVRFVRPLTVSFKSQDVAEESAVGGSNVYVADFISGITDWNKQSVLSVENGVLSESEINGVNMYKYYAFKSMNIKLDDAVRNNVDLADPEAFVNLKKATPFVKLALGTVDGSDFTSTTSPVSIADFDDLKNVVINYQNGGAVVDAFVIKVPVSIEYSWGTLNSELVINVKATSETSGK